MNHKQFKYTVPDISAASGISEVRVRYAIRKGKLNPHDLVDLSFYVVKNIVEASDEKREE